MQLPQTFQGKVIHGEQVGRTIGFPTANLDVIIDPALLDPGVYFGTCQIADQLHFCLPYFGPRLVFGETKNVFEIYLFDFDQEIYDQSVKVTLQQFMRGPLQLASLDELKSQLEADKKAGLALSQAQLHHK